MYLDRDFNKSIGERFVRQADQQKLWLYLVAFRSQTTKHNLLNRLNKTPKFFKIWANFLVAHTDSTV